MKLFRILVAAGLLGTSAQAQVSLRPSYGATAIDRHRYEADLHRLEMDRLRSQADQREALSRQLAVETQLNRLRVEAARRPEPTQPQPYRAMRTPEVERALRRTAEEGRAATVQGVGQIDAWLDRGPR
ncbi:MAG TPA: hypothetical protein VFF48_05470 [Brevundimonas sp.]|nr:hypothetical protein [Brevundimonas sp.]